MPSSKVIVLQGRDLPKLEQEMTRVLQSHDQHPFSITQSQSSIPVVGSRQGWETVITFALVYSGQPPTA